MVRDLWAFRLGKFKLRIKDTTDGDDGHEPEFFSSQPSQTEDSDDEDLKSGSKFLQWPRLLDAVAICYLAAILMRLPVCVNDFHRYALSSMARWVWLLGYLGYMLTVLEINHSSGDSLHQGRESPSHGDEKQVAA